MKKIISNKLNKPSFIKSKKQEKEKLITLNDQISDDSLITKLQDFIVLSDPVCSLINKCQQSNFTIPDAAEEWMKLNVPIEDEKIQEIVQKRIDKVLTPILLAANLLHPHYQGKQFRHNDKYYSQAIEFIRNELNESYHEMEAYENKVGIFESLLKKGNIPPKSFWQMAENSYPVLSQLAQRLINILSSSAQIERLFSNWSFVHSCLRNRLTPERSEKLIGILL
ncbi:GSCOCG00012950001-RA-CDS, partial [Cotesia congregata]